MASWLPGSMRDPAPRNRSVLRTCLDICYTARKWHLCSAKVAAFWNARPCTGAGFSPPAPGLGSGSSPIESSPWRSPRKGIISVSRTSSFGSIGDPASRHAERNRCGFVQDAAGCRGSSTVHLQMACSSVTSAGRSAIMSCTRGIGYDDGARLLQLGCCLLELQPREVSRLQPAIAGKIVRKWLDEPGSEKLRQNWRWHFWSTTDHGQRPGTGSRRSRTG
jgi:hypothetical protein